jgi:transcription antitermination protein NusB
MSKPNSTRGQARANARKLAMQGLYQWQLTGQSAETILQQLLESGETGGTDREYLSELLNSCIDQRQAIDTDLAQFVDRAVEQLDPVEHAVLLIGMYELTSRLDIPYRVIINEGVELTKKFGATDAHKYVNAVLDRAARERRAAERK